MRPKTHYHLLPRILVIMGVVAMLPLSAGFLLIEHTGEDADQKSTRRLGIEEEWLLFAF